MHNQPEILYVSCFYFCKGNGYKGRREKSYQLVQGNGSQLKRVPISSYLNLCVCRFWATFYAADEQPNRGSCARHVRSRCASPMGGGMGTRTGNGRWGCAPPFAAPLFRFCDSRLCAISNPTAEQEQPNQKACDQWCST